VLALGQTVPETPDPSSVDAISIKTHLMFSDQKPEADSWTRPHKLEQRVSSELTTALAEAYRGGETIDELAASFQLARSSVRKLLRSAGVEPRRQPLTPSEVQTATRLYEEGWTLAQLEDEFHRSREAIRRALIRAA
jgi:hypothetical protein